MKTLTTKILLLAAFVVVLPCVVMAGNTAEQIVTITFSEISELAVSGDPGTLEITFPATPGDLPADETEALTTMAWTCNVVGAARKKITGKIDALFSGINLYATVAAPGGDDGTSEGKTQFTAATADYDFVTAIGNTYTSAQTITFTAEVSAMVDPYTDVSQTVTWTLTDDI